MLFRFSRARREISRGIFESGFKRFFESCNINFIHSHTHKIIHRDARERAMDPFVEVDDELLQWSLDELAWDGAEVVRGSHRPCGAVA